MSKRNILLKSHFFCRRCKWRADFKTGRWVLGSNGPVSGRWSVTVRRALSGMGSNQQSTLWQRWSRFSWPECCSTSSTRIWNPWSGEENYFGGKNSTFNLMPNTVQMLVSVMSASRLFSCAFGGCICCAVGRALVSHRCGPGSKFRSRRLSLCWVLFFLRKALLRVPRVPRLSK